MAGRPNFFIVGAPKCGTTALAQYLGEHPEVYFSPNKEPFYFDFDLTKRNPLGLDAYLELFSGVDPGRHKAVGEGSTSYMFSTRAVTEILKFDPNARIIAMLRNPVDLVHAWHSEAIVHSMESLLDFEEAWNAEAERRKGRKLAISCHEPKLLYYSELGKLGDQVERLLSTADRSRVKLIVYDDFASDTRSIYRDAIAFLGLSGDNRQEFPRVNVNRRLRSPRLSRVLTWLHDKARPVRKKLGLTRSFGLLAPIYGWNTHEAQRSPLTDSFRSSLKAFFREDVRKLGGILGRDLSHWVSP